MRWMGLHCFVKLLPFSINSFELNAASVQLPVAQFFTGWKTALYSGAADNVSPCALLCFNYVWHSSHTIIQWQQNEEMLLHWKSNKSKDTCNYVVVIIDYSLKARFLGLIYWWLPTYHPLCISCFDSIVRSLSPQFNYRHPP